MAGPDVVEAKPVASYPATYQDVALVVDAAVVAADVQETMRAAAGELLEDIMLLMSIPVRALEMARAFGIQPTLWRG